MVEVPRPKKCLNLYSRKYPGIWREIDKMRADRGKALPVWPDWCFFPMGGIFSLMMYEVGIDDVDTNDPGHINILNDVGIVSALAPWRTTQGIYRFDTDVYEEVLATPVKGNIPKRVLYQMPEWCIYIETPGLKFFNTDIAGFFAHLEHDVERGRDELRFVIDKKETAEGRNAYPLLVLHLGDWSLSEAVLRAAQESARVMDEIGWDVDIDINSNEFINASVAQYTPFVSLILYLCSANGEIVPLEGKMPENPTPKKTKRGARLFPPNKTTTWDVGVRMGAAIRHARAAMQVEDHGGSHASPRAHIRRAHWHTYWTGPKKNPKKRKTILKWLSPILIGVDDQDMPVTIRPVKK